MCFKTGTPTQSHFKTLSLVVLAALFLSFVGCGKKGDPLPPHRDIPLTTKDLSVFQQGRLLVFELTYPSATNSGLTLGGIDALELLQMVKPAPDKKVADVQAPEFESAATPLLTLRGTELEAALIGNRIQMRVPLALDLPEEPIASYFGIRTLKGEESSEISNLVGILTIEPPNAPQDLRASAGPKAIELTWTAEGEVESFDVFRRGASERGYGKALRRVPADARSFKDTAVRYGERYIYTVRAIASLDPLIWSDEAGEREIDYEDRFAPPLPQGLVALGERGRVRLRWEAADADDVAGYIVYRRDPRREEFTRVNKDDLITRVEFINRGLVSGFTYGFRVQVVDHSGNASEMTDPVTAKVR